MSEQKRNRNNALIITNLQAEVDRLTIDRDAWKLTAAVYERATRPKTKEE